jgi:glyoxylase-like metal-dependent hydrolase (beta-lactamase superfamily II)/rhodanese-related sulfurtransferase
MHFKQFYVGCLAHASYLVGDGGEAVVVDPSRDIDMYLAEAKAHGLAIKWVLETHLHADFVSGHRELAKATGATIALSAEAGAKFAHHALAEGDEIRVGDVRIRALATPGHTPESLSFLVYERAADAEPWGVLTGDTLFVGDVGRVDILSSRLSVKDLAGMMHDSVQQLMRLPDAVRVYPAHGAGSLCGRGIRAESWSTIGQERAMNPALQPMSREAFIADITRDVPETPVYFLHSRDLNQAGPRTREGDELPPALAPARCAEAMARGAVLIDTRPATQFAARHAAGALHVGLDGQYASWVGTLLNPDQQIVLVCESGREQEAVMRLARVGYENVIGFLGGGVEAWAGAGLPTASMALEPVTEALAPGRTILDVRRNGEWTDFHAAGALHLPLARLVESAAALDRNASYVTVCAGGYRAAIGASVLERMGFTNVVATSGGMDAYRKAGLPVETTG